MEVTEHVPLKTLTTFRTGGAARFVIDAEIDEVPHAVLFAKSKNVPLVLLGKGSNILAPDHDVNAAFLRITSRAITEQAEGHSVTVTADAGVEWDAFVSHAVSRGWWGIENLTAIPGTVGAAAVQNIGAYGAVIGDTIHSIEVFDSVQETLHTIPNGECGFGYRTSIFKEHPDRYVILRVRFNFSLNGKPHIEYRDLAEHFLGVSMVTLPHIRKAVADIRAKKFPPLETHGTAGSFFLNPVVAREAAEKMKERFPDMPLFPMPEGGVKIPVAWILDRVLSLKGHRIGKAFLWPAQPLVIAAEFGASSRDVIELAQYVQRLVKEKTNIDISFEVRTLE